MKEFNMNWFQHHGLKTRALDKQEAKDIALAIGDLETLQLISGTTVKEVK